MGVHRSGTTAVAKLLGLSDFAVVQSEPTPNLNAESGLRWAGALSNPKAPLIREVLPRIAKAHQRADIYVEKQNSLLPFISDLHELTNCRFIAMKRSGEETVRSLLNWHDKVFPMFYREAGGRVLADGEGGEFDSSLPRPRPGEEYADQWGNLDRFEMLSWYWNRAMLEFRNQLSQLPSESVFELDINELDIDTAGKLYDFCGLPDFSEGKAVSLLSSRVNSVESRSGDSSRKKTDWGLEEKSKFARFAGPAMRSFQYWEIDTHLPILHGDVSNSSDQSMVTPAILDRFEKWVETMSSSSSLDTKKEISALADFDDTSADQFDLVYSFFGLSSTFDPELFLRRACRSCRQFLYLRCETGWNPKYRQHSISLGEGGAPIVCLSPSETARVLKEEGFDSHEIFPQLASCDNTGLETMIIATRSSREGESLTAHHDKVEVHVSYESKNNETKSAREVIESVNQSCHYFSTSEGGYIADNLVDFDQLIEGISNIESRRVGMMRDFCSGNTDTNLGIRIDVDMDLMAAVDMANLAGLRKVPLSFYLLHTAPYYGKLEDKVFLRNERVSKVYRTIQDQGHEIGLHTDALTIYRDWGIDGAQAVACEIEWLRSQGLEISGTAAHNCAPVYGAENFEVFSEHVIGKRDHTVSQWSHIPLGALSEKELGLAYEANQPKPADKMGTDEQGEYLSGLPFPDFNRNARWMRTYLLENPHNTWGSDYRIWHLGGKFWVVAGMDGSGEHDFRFGVTQADVMEFLTGLNEKRRAVIVLHPAYFGQRLGWGQDPLFSAARMIIPFSPASKKSPKYRLGAKMLEWGMEMLEAEKQKNDES